MLKIINMGIDVGERLDSDGDLEIEFNFEDDGSTESKWIDRKDAIKLAKHLINLFRLDVKEV